MWDTKAQPGLNRDSRPLRQWFDPLPNMPDEPALVTKVQAQWRCFDVCREEPKRATRKLFRTVSAGDDSPGLPITRDQRRSGELTGQQRRPVQAPEDNSPLGDQAGSIPHTALPVTQAERRHELLMPQRDHRIDSRRFPRRDVTGQKRGAQKNRHCQRQCPRIIGFHSEKKRFDKL